MTDTKGFYSELSDFYHLIYPDWEESVFCKKKIPKVAKNFPQQGGGEFSHPSLRIRESLTRLLGPSNSNR